MMMNKKKPFSLHLDVDSFMPATAEEKEVISRMRPSSTFFRDGVKRLLKNKVATISLILIVLITLSSIIIPMFWPYSYDQMLGQTKGRPMDNSYNNLAPFQYGKTELKKIDKGESVFPHIFGTDAHGRDYFIRVVYGTRISLAVGFFASIIVLVIGMMIGAVAGYFGGRVDLFIMRIVDIIYSLPDMLVIILLSVVLGQVLHVEGTILEKIGSNIISMFIVFGLLYWVGMARLIRGQILPPRAGVCAVGAGDGREGAVDYPQAPSAELHQRRDYFDCAANSERDFHRKLPVLPGAGRQRADAFAGFAGF